VFSVLLPSNFEPILEIWHYVKRVLLADDSAVVRRSLRQMFEEAGWSVCGEASNGQEAIVKAQELRPNIIVLDLSMPQINGLTAGHILKEILPGTRLILFTAFGMLLSTDALESAGFSALISKSDAGKLLNTAQTLLNAA
jgi:DNA-binding NarL/FixJ family response regulator